MFANLKSWFVKPKRIAFIDGDQDLRKCIKIHREMLSGIETHLVRIQNDEHNKPKVLRNVTNINVTNLIGFKTKKEVTDKYIGAYIQKVLSDGYKEIIVVSNDFDFVDIFKMIIQLNPNLSGVSFRIITYNAQGSLDNAESEIINTNSIEITKL